MKLGKLEKIKREFVHGLIVKYLIKCDGAFHHGAYGKDGKYVRLFTDEEYDKLKW